MKKRIISFDLDMTLVEHNPKMRIPPSALAAIEKLRETSIIVLATGRDLSQSVNHIFVEWVQPDALVHATGARVAVGSHEIFNCPIPAELLVPLFHEASKRNASLGTILGVQPYFMEGSRVYRERKALPFTEDMLHSRDVYTLNLFEEAQVTSQFSQMFPALSFYQFGHMGCDVVMQGVSKRSGMQRLLDYYGMCFDDVISFGDSDNDVELVKAAGIGVAMGNGTQSVKDVADYVTSDLGSDGIWRACEALHLF